MKFSITDFFSKYDQNRRTALTLSEQRSPSYRNQSIDLQSNPLICWFLYDKDLRHRRVNDVFVTFNSQTQLNNFVNYMNK